MELSYTDFIAPMNRAWKLRSDPLDKVKVEFG